MTIGINNLIVIVKYLLHVTLRQRKEVMKMYKSRNKKLFLNYCKMKKIHYEKLAWKKY